MKRYAKVAASVIAMLALTLVLLIYAVGVGWFGSVEHAGLAKGRALPSSAIEARVSRQHVASDSAFGLDSPKQILFGDLHVHTTFSYDAYAMSLPVAQGDSGTHPPADACDYARYCSELDFWSINDHAEQLTPRLWNETVDSIRQCNALAGDADNPDTVAFLGWEWTQTGPTPTGHFGHRNVVLRDLDDALIPARPIAAPGQGMAIPPMMVRGALALAAGDQRSLDLTAYLRELDDTPICDAQTEGETRSETYRDSKGGTECREIADDPGRLFSRLDELGIESMVIPHGTTWGIYSPPGTDWRKQLVGYHDPNRQRLVEVFSGHGNSERWIGNQAYTTDAEGRRHCPEETASYLPGCQQAGRIIYGRCLAEDLPEEICAQRAAEARQNYVDAGIPGHNTVPGVDMWTEWRDSGQCRDCFLPAFNYRQRGSAQYMLAMTDFSDPENPRRLDFGFIAASDNHTARPGTGYKEFGLTTNTEARKLIQLLSALGRSDDEPVAESRHLNWDEWSEAALKEPERFSSFFYTGGLVAVHSPFRARLAIWDALERKEVYGTSGPRILLWFDLLESAEDPEIVSPMGSQHTSELNPVFRVRAVGSFEQKPGCPDYSIAALGVERLQRLCQGECYHPSDERRRITRIEVVRVRPQKFEGEPIDDLIEDPWQVHVCDANRDGCEFVVEDDEYAASARSAIYYARAIEEASDAVNGAQLGCEYDEGGVCMQMRDCGNNAKSGEDCLSPVEHRAWSSPIFLDRDLQGQTAG